MMTYLVVAMFVAIGRKRNNAFRNTSSCELDNVYQDILESQIQSSNHLEPSVIEACEPLSRAPLTHSFITSTGLKLSKLIPLNLDMSPCASRFTSTQITLPAHHVTTSTSKTQI